jgi:hypothetical protein
MCLQLPREHGPQVGGADLRLGVRGMVLESYRRQLVPWYHRVHVFTYTKVSLCDSLNVSVVLDQQTMPMFVCLWARHPKSSA